MKKLRYLFIPNILLFLPVVLFAQSPADTTTAVVNLKQSIDFALRNQPQLKQANIDEQINERDIRIALSAWLPQLNSSNSFQHFIQRPAQLGVGPGTGQQNFAIAHNVSTIGVNASQIIYNNDVLQASRASKYSRQYYKQNTESSKIDVVSYVSKAFYDVLLSQRQLDIIKEDIVRLRRSLKDAYSRYQAGVVDKTDYKQATIALNNSLASQKQTQEAIKSKTALLKQIMGFNPEKGLALSYDSARLTSEAVVDTNQMLNYTNRVEYRLLQTQKNLLNLNISYYKWGFLPSLSATGGYSLAYFNDSFSKLYNNGYPTSFAGLSLTFPIFTGGKRLQNLAKARLQVERSDLDLINSRNTINTEYAQALANYKSNYNNWLILNENVTLAKDVYKVVDLQYREGIKTYLDVIVSQADLRTAELNYYNALFQLLSSKIDLQRSLGTLQPETIQ
ncbi:MULTISPECIES: TolC family protein [unclassified Mucilaginibacter]|uniref:TolC family protein n=1 Tax=unclassified Mucilaginibacter TaxID=2617802 RepID=UPI002AC98983|nr:MULTISPECIES: TolC family protein [unclassified Mucilaginibacter]MEB0260142.1 TolC family protein [Mucilaginibacter sp. 10I4]MEB0279137.1 TolC family protein [Mucilaginibacter sp. 10B2]MEB0302923.1 TolC family protein [Mucilaginibacter sp. 5C4]WPX22315.1 TolC family protein [Mucilaginibacter sp. 5C4]